MADTITTDDFSTEWGHCTNFDTTGDVTVGFLSRDNTTTAKLWIHKLQFTCCTTAFIGFYDGSGLTIPIVEISSATMAGAGIVPWSWSMDFGKAPIAIKDGTGLAISAADGHVSGLVWYTKG